VSPLLRRHRRTILGAALGAVGGGLYAHFIGCRTGTCLLTSRVWTAALFFGLVGALALSPAAPEESEPVGRPGDAEPR
jgi:hypothetical protein